MTTAADHLRAALLERFARLQADESQPDEISTLDVPVTVAGTSVLLAKDSNGMHLLIPLEPDEHRTFRDDRRSAGVHFVVRALEGAGVLRWYGDLVCLQPRLLSVFVSLLADLIARLEVENEEPQRQVRRCLADWRALLTSGEHMLTTRQLAGLFGELLLLNRCLELDPRATRTWRGPLGEPHDFASASAAVEVKTSLSDDGSIVRVHGLDQLTEPVDGELLLQHLRVSEATEDGLTVVDLVDRAADTASDGLLAARLHAAGYRSVHEDAYRRIAFRVLEDTWYRIDDAFPRIVAASLPEYVVSALGRVEYELDLASASSSALVAEDAANAHLATLLSQA